MKKRLLPILLLVVFAFSITSQAINPKATSIYPSLSFNGTTATCKVSISDIGSTIDATLELWCGTTLIDSWSDTATSRLIISETCKVTKGKTYTLKVSGTIDDETFAGTPVVKTC